MINNCASLHRQTGVFWVVQMWLGEPWMSPRCLQKLADVLGLGCKPRAAGSGWARPRAAFLGPAAANNHEWNVWAKCLLLTTPFQTKSKTFYKIWGSFISIPYIPPSFLLLCSPGSLSFLVLFLAVRESTDAVRSDSPHSLVISLDTLVKLTLALHRGTFAQLGAPIQQHADHGAHPGSLGQPDPCRASWCPRGPYAVLTGWRTEGAGHRG